MHGRGAYERAPWRRVVGSHHMSRLVTEAPHLNQEARRVTNLFVVYLTKVTN